MARAAADVEECRRRRDATYIPPGDIAHTQTQDTWLAWCIRGTWRAFVLETTYGMAGIMYYFCVLLSTNEIGFHCYCGSRSMRSGRGSKELMQPMAKLTKLNPSANL